MTKLGRSMTIRFVVCAMLVLAATSWAQTLPPIAEQIAKTYGLDAFGRIEAIRFTFNVDFGARKLARTWVWEPQADRISYEGKDQAGKPVQATYMRSQLISQPAVVKDDIDPAFVNDQYWLVFPFHLTFRTPSDGDPRIFPVACFARTANPNRDMVSSHARRSVTPLCLRSVLWGSCYHLSKPTTCNICPL